MGELIELFSPHPSRDELLAQLDELHALLEELDGQEPKDMTSDEYELWGQTHEELEDQIDDIMDLLDEL